MAGVLLDARDPAIASLLPPRMRELAETAVAEFPSRGRRFLRSVERGWYRALLRGIERVTVPGIFLHYLMRKLFIEDTIRQSLGMSASAHQVVVIGAGLDTLGARLALDGGGNLRVVEVDHPATQAVKRRALARYGLPREGFSFVELDLTVRTLAEALGDGHELDPRLPVIFVAEGLLMYLTPERAAEFFRELHQISARGSRVVFTFMESDRSDRIRFKSVPWWYGPLLDLWLRRLGEPMRWAIDRSRLAGWLSELGWTLETIADRETFRERYLAPRGLKERALLDGEYVGVARIEV
jgi:methyltransferase (TIGR00027 family)